MHVTISYISNKSKFKQEVQPSFKSTTDFKLGEYFNKIKRKGKEISLM